MFDRENQMLGMTTVRQIRQGHSSKFPVVGSISSEYHTIGNEILGTQVKHAEKVINVDDMLLAHAFIGEIDELKAEYSVRSTYSNEMGYALARTVDKNLINQFILVLEKAFLVHLSGYDTPTYTLVRQEKILVDLIQENTPRMC